MKSSAAVALLALVAVGLLPLCAAADDTPAICLMAKWNDTVAVGFVCSHGVTTADVYRINDSNPPTFTLVGSYPMAQVASSDSYVANFAADWTEGPGHYIINIRNDWHDAGSICLDVRTASQYLAVRQDIQRVEQGLFTRLYDRDTNAPSAQEAPAAKKRKERESQFK